MLWECTDWIEWKRFAPQCAPRPFCSETENVEIEGNRSANKGHTNKLKGGISPAIVVESDTLWSINCFKYNKLPMRNLTKRKTRKWVYEMVQFFFLILVLDNCAVTWILFCLSDCFASCQTIPVLVFFPKASFNEELHQMEQICPERALVMKQRRQPPEEWFIESPWPCLARLGAKVAF